MQKLILHLLLICDSFLLLWLVICHAKWNIFSSGIEICSLVPFKGCTKHNTAINVSIVNSTIFSSSYSSSTCGRLYDLVFLTFAPSTPSDVNESSIYGIENYDIFIYPAVLLATEQINNQSARNFELQVKVHNTFIGTRNDIAHSVFYYNTEVYKLLSTKRIKVSGLVGPGNYEVAEVSSSITGVRFCTLSVSYGATDISFNNRVVHPYLHRTVPSVEAVNRAKLCLMEHFQWKRAALISSSNTHYAKVSGNFVGLAKEKGFNVDYLGNFVFDVHYILKEIIRHEIKIIIGSFDPKDARNILCQAFKEAKTLLDSTHVWIFPHYYHPLWWRIDDDEIAKLPLNKRCSNSELEKLLTSILFVDSLKYNVIGNWSKEDAYQMEETVTTFIEKLIIKTKSLYPSQNISEDFLRHSQAAAAFDAVWSLTLAYNEELKRSINEISPECLNNSISNLTLNGLSKLHHFGKGQDYKSNILVSQFIGGKIKPVKVISFDNNHSCQFVELRNIEFLPGYTKDDFADDFYWRDGLPSDGITVEYSYISVEEFIISVSIVLPVFCIHIALLAFLIIFRNNKHIKASSPKFMMLAIIGFITVLPSSIVYGLILSTIYYNISKPVSDLLCNLQVPLNTAGFVLAYSIFMVKSWRIYRIFHNSKNSIISNISDVHLSLFIAVLVGVYACIQTIWIFLSPLYISSFKQTVSTTKQICITICTDKYELYELMRFIMIFYKIILLIFLLYLSYKNSKIPTRFQEEGQAGIRMVLAVIILSIVFIIIYILSLSISYKATYWTAYMYTTFAPVVYLAAILLPKFHIMYNDYHHWKNQKDYLERSRKFSSRINTMQLEVDKLKMDIKKKEEKISELKYKLTNDSVLEQKL